MQGFKKFFKEDEDVKKTIAKLPKKHRDLIKGFEFRFEPHNTLHGDKGHVGLITNDPKKMVRIASPWRFPREFTVLHEIGHLVYEAFVRGKPLEKEWAKIVRDTKEKKKDETPEEQFCHGFANHYTQHKMVLFDHKTWHDFMERLAK